MNVSTITMDRYEAGEKLRAYRTQLHRRADAEYEAAAAGYAALAEGKPLVHLTNSIVLAGLGADDRPRLAIARADQRQVCVESLPAQGQVRFRTDSRWDGRRRLRDGRVSIQYPGEGSQLRKMQEGFALVPMVPADVRPRVDMTHCFILWEVEQWAARPVIAVPDRDPFLLRHIAGDLYAVLAQWDLTELERAVMAGRRQG